MAEDQLKKYLLFAEILANYKKIAIFFLSVFLAFLSKSATFLNFRSKFWPPPIWKMYYVIQVEVGCRNCRPERLKLPAPIHLPIHDRCKDDAPGP